MARNPRFDVLFEPLRIGPFAMLWDHKDIRRYVSERTGSCLPG